MSHKKNREMPLTTKNVVCVISNQTYLLFTGEGFLVLKVFATMLV